MRVWHRLDADADPVLLDTAAGPNNHTLLRRQGLLPEFTGGGRAGDFWIVTVRPNTPQQVTPWNLTQGGGVPPHGPRHLFAPLSLISFRPPVAGEHANTEVVDSVQDCRRLFRRSWTGAAAARTRSATASARRATTSRFRRPLTTCPPKAARSACCRALTPRPSASSAATSSSKAAGGRRRCGPRRATRTPRSSTCSRRA